MERTRRESKEGNEIHHINQNPYEPKMLIIIAAL